jgi:hypothetical protein
VKLDPSCESQLVARIAATEKLADSPVAVDDKGPSIVWSKTWSSPSARPGPAGADLLLRLRGAG